MTVSLDGVQQYAWPVSTGVRGYTTPSGTYNARSMNKIWYSAVGQCAHAPRCVLHPRWPRYSWHSRGETPRQTGLAWLCAALTQECSHTLRAGRENRLKEYAGSISRQHSGG